MAELVFMFHRHHKSAKKLNYLRNHTYSSICHFQFQYLKSKMSSSSNLAVDSESDESDPENVAAEKKSGKKKKKKKKTTTEDEVCG